MTVAGNETYFWAAPLLWLAFGLLGNFAMLAVGGFRKWACTTALYIAPFTAVIGLLLVDWLMVVVSVLGTIVGYLGTPDQHDGNGDSMPEEDGAPKPWRKW